MSFRSGAERRFAELLLEAGVEFGYEVGKLPYVLHRNYTPDFTVDGVHLEVKGYWRPGDRSKLKAVRLANPHARLIVLFTRPHSTISKKSKTTYAQWCERWGIEWMELPRNPHQLSQCLDRVSSRLTTRAPGAGVRTQLQLELTTR